jgi:trehalose/maltose hydrolase-like predicted phosphorylase
MRKDFRAGGLGSILLLLAGCHTPRTTSDAGATAPANRAAGAFSQLDPWRLTTADANANRGNHGIFLGNGAVGVTVGPSGGADRNSVFFVAGKYDAKENIARQPLPAALPEPKPGEPYAQTLDLQHGVLNTKTGASTLLSYVPVDAKGLVTSTPSDPSVAAHEAAWAARWRDADIKIEGDPEAEQLVHKLMFDLLQSTRPGASDSIPPESLSGDFYKGHIFWDAEVWMFPALLAQHPEYAKSILDYRSKHLPEAKALARAEGCQGADFPWESAASGKEVAPGGFSEGRHVTAGVGWAAWQYYLATADKSYLRTEGWPLLAAVADYWATRAKPDAAGMYEIRKVFGPDELTGTVDNNTYTNALARDCLLAAGQAAKIVGQPANPKWAVAAQKLAIPFDVIHRRFLARQNDAGGKTKQADGELVLYPAEFPMDKATANATFDFHSPRPIRNGPAMTSSIHALIAARLGRPAEAERDFRDSYRPFVRGPFLLFSEKRSLDRCVFTTGAGGILQAVLYGFGGLDYAHWDQITKQPVCLPPAWKKLTITGIRHAGKRYTLTVTPRGRTLTAE